MKTNMRYFMTAVSLIALMGVAGCKTAANAPVVGAALDSLAGKYTDTERRLSTSAAFAIAEGRTDEALALYERLYKHTHSGFSAPDKGSKDIALNYAQLLRKTGDAKKAITVLTPYVKTRRGNWLKKNVDPVMLNEYAASSIEVGNFSTAEKLLNRVLEDKKAAKFHADAYSLLGVSLDAQGQHKAAEQSYRKSLEKLKGDQTSVMNNLGLSLASQGKFDESLKILNQALVMAPGKQEIAQNIRIVNDLKKTPKSAEELADGRTPRAQPPSLPPVFKDTPGGDASKSVKSSKKKKKKK